jgi:hypothetical protein
MEISPPQNFCRKIKAKITRTKTTSPYFKGIFPQKTSQIAAAISSLSGLGATMLFKRRSFFTGKSMTNRCGFLEEILV